MTRVENGVFGRIIPVFRRCPPYGALTWFDGIPRLSAMLFGKYHLVIFREGQSGSRNVNLHGWVCAFIILLMAALIGCAVWLASEWLKSRHLQASLANAERAMAEQRHQTINLAERITALGQDLERVRRFDSKLRLMMNMEKDPDEVGDGPGDFSRAYIPLHRQELAVRKMQSFLDKLSESTRLEEVRQQDLLRALRGKRDVLASTPSIWPVTGFVSSSFGGRQSPFGRGGQFHKGLDISNRIGTPIIAPADGTVIMAAPDGAYGNSVEINHGGGIVTKYAHMQRSIVKPGQWVRRGEVLGYIGVTGRTTGPHLHYEVRLNGTPVNPMRYILE